MTMKEQFKIRNQKPFFRIAAFAVIVVLFVVFGTPLGLLIRDMFVSVLSATAIDLEYASLSKEALAARLKDAERELSHIRYQATLFTLLTEENAHLRDAAGAGVLPGGRVARVVGRPPQTHYDSLLIDAGSRDGLLPDDLAVFEGIALGRVASVGERSATIELFSSPGSERDVLVGSPVAVSIARGVGGGSFRLSVPREVSVQVGDVIRLPASESLALGVVTDVSFEPTDISQTVLFATPVSFSELDFIRVIPQSP